MIITASHNPPQYNGIKFVDEDGIGIAEDMELEIEDMFFNENPNRVSYDEIGEVTSNEGLIDEYNDEVVQRVDQIQFLRLN